MAYDGLLSALEGGWADTAHGFLSTPLHPGNFGLFGMGFST
jgi:hypothetical protein